MSEGKQEIDEFELTEEEREICANLANMFHTRDSNKGAANYQVNQWKEELKTGVYYVKKYIKYGDAYSEDFMTKGDNSALKYPSFDHLPQSLDGWPADLTWFLQEKVDGSQYTFGLWDGELVLLCQGKDKSKESMFASANDAISLIKDNLNPDYTYHGEYLSKPGHNVITYERRPKMYVILYDIKGPEGWLHPCDVVKEAERIGLESVPLLYVHQEWQDQCDPRAIAEMFFDDKYPSCLGGNQMEGMVIKIIHKPGVCNPARVHKICTEIFKEKHKIGVPDKERILPSVEKIIEDIGLQWNVRGRFRKALIHLKENGVDVSEPLEKFREIENELDKDLSKEAKDEIKLCLWGDLKKLCLSKLTEGCGAYYVEKYCPEEEKQNYKKLVQKIDPQINRIGRNDHPNSKAKKLLEDLMEMRSFRLKPELIDHAVKILNFPEHKEENTQKLCTYLRTQVDVKGVQGGLYIVFFYDIFKAARRDLKDFLTIVQETGQLIGADE